LFALYDREIHKFNCSIRNRFEIEFYSKRLLRIVKLLAFYYDKMIDVVI